MDSYEYLPEAEIKPRGIVSKKFLELGVNTFRKACDFVHNKAYGYNSNYDDKMIFFKENMGTCTTKHATIAGLAEELNIPLYKYVGIYKFTEEITTGVDKITKKYEVPYVPMVHCFLAYEQFQFDLTEGNYNGKKKPIDEYIHAEKVEPFISSRDEYRLFRKVLNEKIMKSEELKGISKRNVLKARQEAIILLKDSIK